LHNLFLSKNKNVYNKVKFKGLKKNRKDILRKLEKKTSFLA